MFLSKLKCSVIFLVILLLSIAVSGSEDFLPAQAEERMITDWLTVGPFSAGTREGYIDPLYEQGGQLNITPKKGMKHSSSMAEGGIIEWQETKADEKGKVDIAYKGVGWESLQKNQGWPALQNMSYGYTEFENKGWKRALILAEKASRFWLNGTPHLGGPYGHGFVHIPVVLKDGINRLLIKLSGYEALSFTFRILPVEGPVMLQVKDVTAPDVVYGQTINSWIGVPVINTTTKTLDVKLTLGGDERFCKITKMIEYLAPLSIQKVPIQLIGKRPLSKSEVEEDKVQIPIEVSTTGWKGESKIALITKARGMAYTTTFLLSLDNSVQCFSVLPPEDFDSTKSYGLILTVHGAGVRCEGQVNAYTKKDWAYVVAPTNRRRYGFDWQDWGRLNALNTLEEAVKRFDIDENRIYLTGHSMGGHGVWNIGLQHPDQFAAIAPSAGWNSFELYIPFFLRKDHTFASPKQRTIFERVRRANRSLVLMENALDLPIYVLQGSDDESVPPTHPRRAVKTLRRLGYEVKYNEVPGKGHWWREEGIPGTACVNHPELMKFLREKVRNPLPKHVVYKTMDLGLNNRAYWVSIERQNEVFSESMIEAQVTGVQSIGVNVANVNEFTLYLKKGLVELGKLEIVVNGTKITTELDEYGEVKIHRTLEGKFALGEVCRKDLKKTPDMYGPIKAAYFTPFVLIYGTKNENEMQKISLNLARIEAQQWWRRANGYVCIIPDTAVTEEIIRNYNLILFGGPEVNSVTNRINRDLPITLNGNRVKIGKHTFKGGGIAVKFLYPNPLNQQKFVVVNEGTDQGGLYLTGSINTLYAGAGIPDYLIYNRQTEISGDFLAAGFFDNNWSVSESQGYFAPVIK